MTIALGGVAPPTYERRIGERYPIRIEAGWGPAPTTRRERKQKLTPVVTDNISLSGLGFEADTRAGIGRGSPIRISIGDEGCHAMVRATRPGSVPGRTFYGVEFTCQGLVSTVEDLIGDRYGTTPLPPPLD